LILNLQGYPIKIPNPPKDKDIFGYDKPKAEQYWVRPYQYTDEQYEFNLTPAEQDEVRRIETERRVAGFWFWNNGERCYLTGDAYFYFTHWKMDGDYPLFMMNQVEDYLFDKFCEDDPYCFGSVRMKPRREGCTQRRLASFVNQATLEFNSHYGIQSKNAEDAETVNFDNLVKSFFQIPKWMQPTLQNTSLPPHKEIIFGKKRGTRSEAKNEVVLNNKIDWRATIENAYDGSKLKKFLGDEIFKWFPNADFIKAWDIIKYCLQNRGIIYGKAYLLSTVGEISNDSVEVARYFWRGSNYAARENNQTETGVYRWFIPDWCAYFGLILNEKGDVDFTNGTPVLDKYGYINVPLVKKHLKKKLDSIKGEQEKVNFIRKNPPTAEDALNYGAASNVFDTFRLMERKKELENFEPTAERPVQYLRGTLAWVNNERFGQVEFKSNPEGKWRIAYLPDIAGRERVNMVYRENNIIKPFSHTPFRMGVDPFSYNDKEGDGFSKGAFHVKIMSNANNPQLSNVYCLEYIFREKRAEMFYEDIALTMFYYGLKMNFERSAYSKGLERYLEVNRLMGFAMSRPDVTKKTKYTQRDDEKGTPSTEDTIAMGIRYIENYIAEPNPLLNENTTDYLKLFWFEESIKQLMDYTVKNKTRFDAVASMIHTEIACQPDKRVKEAAKDHVEMRAKVMRYMFRQPEPQNQTRALA